VKRRQQALLSAATAVAVAVGGVVLAAPAQAKGSRATIVRGDCSGATNWKLKAKPDDGRMEVELEVDSNRTGQRWTYTIRHDGVVTASGRRTTTAPSGSFSVERRIVDAPGAHRITATAKNLRTGEICRAALVR
jgi:hypothetical protein